MTRWRLFDTGLRTNRPLVFVAGAVAMGVITFGAWTAVTQVPGPAGEPRVPADATGSSSTPSPSPALVALTWDPAPDLARATENLVLPACGDEWAPEPVAVNGATPVTLTSDWMELSWPGIPIAQTFDFGTGEPAELLYLPHVYVITLDGVVVGVRDVDARPLRADLMEYAPPLLMNSAGSVALSGASTCAGQEAFRNQFGDADFEAMTWRESAEFDQATWQFYEDWEALAPGTYQVYSVVPMVFGEQAALGGELVKSPGEVLDDTLNRYGFILTRLSDLRRMDEGAVISDPLYCDSVLDDTGYEWTECDVPAEVVTKMLTREIDPARIGVAAYGVGISAPLEIVIVGATP